MAKPVEIEIDLRLVVPVVGDAALAGPVAEGRLVPVLIVDLVERPDVAELLRVHAHISAGGDAASIWGTVVGNDDQVALHLRWSQPIEVELILLFSIEHQAILVEQMLSSGGVYLQSGKAGDRLKNTFFVSQRVLVELADTGFRPIWDALLLDRMTTVMARRIGVPRRRGKPAAEAVIAELRKLSEFRMQR